MIHLSVIHLREALKGLRKLGLRKDATPVLQQVKIVSDGKEFISLTMTDRHQCLSTQLRPFGRAPKVEFLVPYAALAAVTKGMKPSDTVTLEPNATHGGKLHGNGKPIKYRSDKTEQWPLLPNINKAMGIIRPEALQSISEALPCASTDATRPVLNSVLLGKDRVVATDGRQFYLRDKLRFPLRTPVIMPASKAYGIIDPGQEAVLLRAKLSVPWLAITQQAWTWSFRLVQGNYPNWQQVRVNPRKYPNHITLSERDVELVMKHLTGLPVAKERNAPVVLHLRRDKAEITVGNVPRREVFGLRPEHLSVRGEVSTSFNLHYLVGALQNGLRTISVNTPHAPLVLHDKHREQLFMPLRMNAERAAA